MAKDKKETIESANILVSFFLAFFNAPLYSRAGEKDSFSFAVTGEG